MSPTTTIGSYNYNILSSNVNIFLVIAIIIKKSSFCTLPSLFKNFFKNPQSIYGGSFSWFIHNLSESNHSLIGVFDLLIYQFFKGSGNQFII